MARTPNFARGQGATEYLVLLAVVLVIALVSIALLGFFPGLSADAKLTASQSYWSGVAAPFRVAAAGSVSGDMCTEASKGGYALAVENSDSKSLTITGITADGAAVDYCAQGASKNLPIAIGPGERRVLSIITSQSGSPCTEGQAVEVDLRFNYSSALITGQVQKGDKKLMLRCSTPGSGGGGGGSACANLSQSCLSLSCCSGLTCSGGLCSSLSPPPECTEEGGDCSSADCCEGLDCVANVCTAQPACIGDGEACTGAGQCCGGLVCDQSSGGKCAAGCIPSGPFCASNAECCDGTTCQAGGCYACLGNGDGCSMTSECCSGMICNGYWSACSLCPNKDDACASDSDCCSGLTCQNDVCKAG